MESEEQCMRDYGVHYKILKELMDERIAQGGTPIWSVDQVRKADNPAEYERAQELATANKELQSSKATIDSIKAELEALKASKAPKEEPKKEDSKKK